MQNSKIATLLSEAIESIVSLNTELARFWIRANGWAPPNAAELMSKSRLDWQIELSNTLNLWTSPNISDGKLILGWTNLGALIEGTLKLYLCIYYNDYINDKDRVTYNGKTIDPDSLAFEKLKQFCAKKKLLDADHIKLVSTVQHKRNAIHAFKNRSIGTSTELHECIFGYAGLLKDCVDNFPYPDR